MYRINGRIQTIRPLSRWIFICAVLMLWPVGTGWGQFYAHQDGLLDANNRVGSLGLNTNMRFDSIIPRANMYITGNVRGGARFQGVVPYSSPYEFQGGLGSAALSTFRRDSTGVDTIMQGQNRSFAYIDPSRSVTTTMGGNIVDTSGLNLREAVPTGASLSPRTQYRNQLLSRPLDTAYSFRRVRSYSGMLPDQQYRPVQSGLPEGINVPMTDRLDRDPILSDEDQDWLTPEMQMEEFRRQRDREETERQEMRRTEKKEGLNRQEEELEEIDPFAYRPLAPLEQMEDEPEQEDEDVEERKEFTPALRGVDRQAPTGNNRGMSLSPILREAQARELSPTQRQALKKKVRQHYQYYLQLGRAMLKSGRFYQAAYAFDQAIQINPYQTRPTLHKAIALFGAGEFMSAAFYLERALELSPAQTAEQIDLSEMFPDAQKLQGKLNELNKWQERTGQPMLMFLQGYVYYQTGDADAARAVLTGAAEKLPDAESVKTLLELMDMTGD